MSFNVPKGLRKVFYVGPSFASKLIIFINIVSLWRLANDHNADVLMRCRTVLVSMRNVDRFGCGMITKLFGAQERACGLWKTVGGVETEQRLSMVEEKQQETKMKIRDR